MNGVDKRNPLIFYHIRFAYDKTYQRENGKQTKAGMEEDPGLAL